MMILTAMVSFYLTAPEAHRTELRDTRERLRATLGDLGRPIMLVMQSPKLRSLRRRAYRAPKNG